MSQSKNFSLMLGRVFLGSTSTKQGGDKVPCLKTQHSDSTRSEARTSNPLILDLNQLHVFLKKPLYLVTTFNSNQQSDFRDF